MSVQIATRVPEELAERMRLLMAREQRSMGQLLRLALEAYVSRYERFYADGAVGPEVWPLEQPAVEPASVDHDGSVREGGIPSTSGRPDEPPAPAEQPERDEVLMDVGAWPVADGEQPDVDGPEIIRTKPRPAREFRGPYDPLKKR